MRYQHPIAAGIVLGALALPHWSRAFEPPTDKGRAPASESRGQIADEIERIRDKYQKKMQKLGAAYNAEIEALRAESALQHGESSGDAAKSLAGGPAVVVFTQFRPNDDKRHVLHILASDGRSILIPYEFLDSMHGEWKLVPGGIEYRWNARDSSGTGIIKIDPRHQRYAHSTTKGTHDDLINASGSKVVGDMSFLLRDKGLNHQQEGEPDD